METYSAPVDKLLTFRTLDSEPAIEEPDFVKEFGLSPENIPDLIRMATNPDLLKDDDTVFTEEEKLTFAGTFYALEALKQLKAEEAIEPLLTLYKNQPDNEWAMEELIQFYGTIGAKAIPALANVISTSSSDKDEHLGYAVEALGAIGVEHPETRLEVINTLVSLLNEGKNREVNGSIVSQLVTLRAVETADEVKQAFEEGRVEEDYAGDWDEFQFSIGLRVPTEEEKKRRSSSLRPNFFSSIPSKPNLTPVYASSNTSYLPKPAQKVAPTKKKKDKQAKASRKQNRRKK